MLCYTGGGLSCSCKQSALALAWPWKGPALALAWPWDKLIVLGLGLDTNGLINITGPGYYDQITTSSGTESRQKGWEQLVPDECIFVFTTDTTVGVKPVPVYAVITALEHCERYLRSLQHEDLDLGVSFFIHFLPD